MNLIYEEGKTFGSAIQKWKKENNIVRARGHYNAAEKKMYIIGVDTLQRKVIFEIKEVQQ